MRVAVLAGLEALAELPGIAWIPLWWGVLGLAIGLCAFGWRRRDRGWPPEPRDSLVVTTLALLAPGATGVAVLLPHAPGSLLIFLLYFPLALADLLSSGLALLALALRPRWRAARWTVLARGLAATAGLFGAAACVRWVLACPMTT